jgi:uncharacterized membrane protein YphA (DoxX/SURF4 family)
LLLRAAVGVAAIVQGAFYLANGFNSAPGAWLGGLYGVAVGALLAIGFVTPVAALLAGLAAVGSGLSMLPTPSPNLFDEMLSTVFAAIMTAAIVFLGPGAYSLDARLFGRREIIIPSAPRPPKSSE